MSLLATRANWQLLLTCEHASNAVPKALHGCFEGARTVLRTHRGYDIGALAVAQRMAQALHAPLFAGGITRLLIDLNRSVQHRQLHSEFADGLAPAVRAELIEHWHTPFRIATGAALQRMVAVGPVLHLSVHSFTPVWHGHARNCEIGLLYDPKRNREQQMARGLANALRGPLLPSAQRAQRTAVAALRVRMNYPYRGDADGHTTSLRKLFPDAQYVGIEIELNQALLRRATAQQSVADQIIRAVRQAVVQ